MENPFEQIMNKLNEISLRLDQIEGKITPEHKVKNIGAFAKKYNVTRSTVYNWQKAGIIEFVRVAGKSMVNMSTIKIDLNEYISAKQAISRV